jgi:hypothetical protein
MEYWKITEFSKEVGKHLNTVDGWFKKMEEQKLHWVNRSEHGEKIYNTLDMKIAQFIKVKRAEKWSIESIFNELPIHFELRPVPEEDTSESQIVDPAMIRNEFEEMAKGLMNNQMNEIQQYFKEVAAAQMEETRKHYESLVMQLPKPKSLEEERQEHVTDMITRRRVESQLRKEALQLWSQKPGKERKIWSGVFLIEDINKRDIFIEEYIVERIEERIKHEYGLQ